jgi:hypothetical protein
MENPENRVLVLKRVVSSLWPRYIGERRTTFAKAYGIKVRVYGEYVGEHIGKFGNILGTSWELKGNIEVTHREPGKNEKKSSHYY